MASRLVDLLRTVDIFERLAEPELQKLSKLFKERRFRENQVVVQQGDPGDALYVVLNGRARVSITDQFGREKVLAFLGEGQPFGEAALLTGAPRSATVTASTDLKVLTLRKDDFDVLLSGNVDVMKEMMRVMAARQSVINQRVSEEASADAGQVRGLLTVIYSPRGGSGRSLIAANLAVSLAEATPDRVALVDLDLLFGQQTVMFNLNPRTSLSAVTPSALKTMDRETFSFYLNSHDESSLKVLVGATRPEEGEMITGDHVRTAMDLMRRQFVHVVVDTNGNFSDANLALMEMADQVIMVVTPELVTIRDLRECQRIFYDLLNFPRERFDYVLNHPLPYGGVPTDQIELGLDVKILTDIPFGGETPTKSQLEGEPLVVKWPNNGASKAISAIASHVDRKAKEALALSGR